jgi:hypothetical protein
MIIHYLSEYYLKNTKGSLSEDKQEHVLNGISFLSKVQELKQEIASNQDVFSPPVQAHKTNGHLEDNDISNLVS